MSRSRGMSLAEWVRQALDVARRREPVGSSGRKLEAIRIAAQQQFPVSDITDMLSEIGQGYSGTRRP